MTQLLAIFRTGADTFVELKFDEHSVATEGECFSVTADDSYTIMDFDHLVIAEQIEGGSNELVRVQLRDDADTNRRVALCRFNFETLSRAIMHVWNAYKDNNHALDTTRKFIQ